MRFAKTFLYSAYSHKKGFVFVAVSYLSENILTSDFFVKLFFYLFQMLRLRQKLLCRLQALNS